MRDENGDLHQHLLPFYDLTHASGGADRRLAIFPLLYFRRRSPETDYDHVFPLLSRWRSGESSHVLSWPFFQLASQPQSAPYRYIPTLFRYGTTDEANAQRLGFPFLFEYYRAGEPGEQRYRRTVSGPLYRFHYSAGSDGRWFHLLPLGFGRWEGEDSSLGIFPSYYGRAHGSADLDYWSAGRFFYLWSRLENDRQTHTSFLWKVMDWTSSPDGDHDFRILHRLFADRRVESQREILLNPFFRYFDDRRTGRSHFSVFRLLQSSEIEEGVRTRRILFIPVWRGDA